MRKILLTLGLSLSLATGVSAADSALDPLNSKIVSALAPFQSETTIANLSFDQVETDADHVLNLALKGLYRKVGPNNTFEVKLDNFSYHHGDGSAPIVTFKESINTDFTKFPSQFDSKSMIPFILEVIDNFVDDYSRGLKDAISIKNVITSQNMDNEGNYTSLSAMISAKIDLTKLPPEDISFVTFTDFVFHIAIDLKTGISVDTYFVLNPAHYSFDNQHEFVQVLNLLLAGDAYTIAGIVYQFGQLESAASQIVGAEQRMNGKNIFSILSEPLLQLLDKNLKRS